MAPERLKRKLSAILSADVEGYSRLMAEDEAATVRTLNSYRATMTSLIEDHRGRVVDSPGDNLLAEFISVVDAVQCAVEIQQVLKAKNAELPENRRMAFRIGINLGDVIEEGDRIYGDGINIAARIEGLAEGGGICISGSAYEQIENKLALGYEDLGEHRVKNIAKPIRVYRVPMEPRVSRGKEAGMRRWQKTALAALAVLVIGTGAITVWNYLLRPSPPPPVEVASVEKKPFPVPKKPSIAVMPFENLSGDPELEYMADGISENIIATISKIPEMIVSARNSTFAYKGKRVKVQQVAEELDVHYALEGSILKSGNRLRVTAQLVDAVTGHHLWTEQYEPETKDLLDMLDEITHEIAIELQVKLTAGKQIRTWAKGTDNLEAWDYVSQSLRLPATKEGNAKARELLEQAVNLDPQYAAAWAWLAFTHIQDADGKWTESPGDSYRRALQLTQKALELDDSNPLAHALLGQFHRGQGQYGKAITEGEKAIALGPKSGLVHALFSNIMHRAGRPDEAIRLVKKAMHLDPYYPAPYLFLLAQACHQAGNYEEALEAWKLLLQRSEKGELWYWYGLVSLPLTCIELGREDEARTYAEELFKDNPNLSLSGVANALRFYKNRAELEHSWSALRKAGIVAPIASTATEYRYKGPPAFTVKYPKGRTEKESLDPARVFKTRTSMGLIEFYIFVDDIPKGMDLADVGPEAVAPVLEKDVGAKVRVLSNEEIKLVDGTKSYKTELEWTHRKGHLVKVLLVSAFKEKKWVQVAGVTVGDPSEIEKLVESLKFTPLTIPVTGNIQQVRGPDNILTTLIFVDIGKDFTGKLPGDIDTITVTGPIGDLPIARNDFSYSPQWREFSISILGSPEIGTYTFTVASGNERGTAADTQSVLRALPIPDTDTFSPSDGQKVSSKSLTFSWGAVDAEVPISYRLDINDLDGNRVYMTDFVQEMLSHTVPVDKLVPGQSYLWRVRVADSSEWVQIQNRATSKWLKVTVVEKSE